MSKPEHSVWSDSPNTRISSQWSWEGWQEWDGISFTFLDWSTRKVSRWRKPALCLAGMQWDFSHWVANSFLLSAGQDTFPNPTTFHSAKHNKYGSTAFGEGKTPEQSPTDAEIIPAHEKWEQLCLLPHPQAMLLARCQQSLILFELLTLHMAWLLHGVISVYYCPFTVSILQGDTEMRNVSSGGSGTKVTGCKSYLCQRWHTFAKLGAEYRVLKWEKFPLHPVKTPAAQGQRVPAGVVMLHWHCMLSKVIISDIK